MRSGQWAHAGCVRTSISLRVYRIFNKKLGCGTMLGRICVVFIFSNISRWHDVQQTYPLHPHRTKNPFVFPETSNTNLLFKKFALEQFSIQLSLFLSLSLSLLRARALSFSFSFLRQLFDEQTTNIYYLNVVEGLCN